jgi:hypothetical protein
MWALAPSSVRPEQDRQPSTRKFRVCPPLCVSSREPHPAPPTLGVIHRARALLCGPKDLSRRRLKVSFLCWESTAYRPERVVDKRRADSSVISKRSVYQDATGAWRESCKLRPFTEVLSLPC